MAPIFFRFPYDLHLLRGQSTNLADILELPNIEGRASLTFVPQFQGTEGEPSVHTGFGIRVNTASGEITTQRMADESEEARQTQWVYNFIVKVLASDESPQIRETAIRIHLHQSLTGIRITPATLTVQQGLANNQFSLRALYDDGIEAYIGPWYRLANSGSEDPEYVDYDFNGDYTINWRSEPEVPGLIDNDGFISPTEEHGRGPHPVFATLLYDGVSYEARAEILIDDTLSNPVSAIAEQVPSRVDRRPPSTEEAVNVLFLTDGFTADQRPLFNSIVNHLVADLGREKISAPLDILQPAMKFWKVFTPSPEAGATHQREVIIKESGAGTSQLKVLPLPQEPSPERSIEDWRSRHLLWYAGLPVPGDESLESAILEQRWRNTTNLTGEQIDILLTRGATIHWRRMARRILPAERNTFFGVQVHDRTAITEYDDYESVHFNPNRFFRSDLDTFLFNLRDRSGNHLGRQFTKAHPDCGTGKDFDRIVFLTPIKYGRENNFDGGFFCAIQEARDENPCSGDENGYLWTDPPPRLPLLQKGTFLHELGHSLGLGDEYGERPPISSWADKTTDDPEVAAWHYADCTIESETRLQYLDADGNTLLGQDLRSPAGFDPQNIKWRYHRIEKCGVLSQPPEISGNIVTCTLRDDEASKFNRGDVVFLRRRKRFEAVAHTFRGEGELAFVLPPVLLVSQRLIVDRVEGENQIVATSQPEDEGGRPLCDFTAPLPSYRPGTTPPGEPELEDPEGITILYKPVTLPDEEHEFSRLLTRTVETYLRDRRPYAFNATAEHEYIDRNPIQSARDLDSSVHPPCASRIPEVVGLYTCGWAYHGNAYHATGRCIMRRSTYWNSDEPDWDGWSQAGDQRNLEQYCAVCRYVITDMVDPSKHPNTDRLYRRRKIDLDHR